MSPRPYVQFGRAALVSVLACSRSTPHPREPGEMAAIGQARIEQNELIARGDFERVASYWTDDVTITAGLGRTMRGREEYRRAFTLDSAMTYERTPQAIDVSATWPLAFETGTWIGRRRGTSSSDTLRGRYSAQWVRVAGRWLIRSEVFVALDCAGSPCRWPALVPHVTGTMH
jgi:ketosteroid isomerase-like protein